MISDGVLVIQCVCVCAHVCVRAYACLRLPKKIFEAMYVCNEAVFKCKHYGQFPSNWGAYYKTFFLNKQFISRSTEVQTVLRQLH